MLRMLSYLKTSKNFLTVCSFVHFLGFFPVALCKLPIKRSAPDICVCLHLLNELVCYEQYCGAVKADVVMFLLPLLVQGGSMLILSV